MRVLVYTISTFVLLAWAAIVWGPQARYEVYSIGEGVFVRIGVDSGDVCLTSMELGEWVCAEELRGLADLLDGGTIAEEDLLL